MSDMNKIIAMLAALEKGAEAKSSGKYRDAREAALAHNYRRGSSCYRVFVEGYLA